MAKLERNYTIPLRRDFVKVPKHERAKRAINYVKRFMTKHMKEEDVRIGKHLNETIWQNGMKNPPGRVSVLAIKEDGYVTVELTGKKYEVFKVQTEVDEKPTGLKGKLQEAMKGKETEEPEEPEEKKTSEKDK